MKVEKFETIRVKFEDGVYCDITPDVEVEGVFEFWLYRTGYDSSVYMFSCEVNSDEHAVDIAASNVPDYTQYLE